MRHLLPYLSDRDTEIRASVANALGNYPEHAGWSLPAIDAAMGAESDEGVREALAKSRARLTRQPG